MEDSLTLAVIDCDGAIAEAADTLLTHSRGAFLRRTALAAGGLAGAAVASGALPAAAQAATRNDVSILNFALTLEYLEAAFYTEAERRGRMSGETARFVRVVGEHERAHVAFLQRALGSAAVKRPRFNFHDTTSHQAKFRQAAMMFEDLGVTAYEGQAPSIDSGAVLAAAGSILAVEARHASWIRSIRSRHGDHNASPAPDAFNRARTKEQVLRIVRSTGFIVS